MNNGPCRSCLTVLPVGYIVRSDPEGKNEGNHNAAVEDPGCHRHDADISYKDNEYQHEGFKRRMLDMAARL